MKQPTIASTINFAEVPGYCDFNTNCDGWINIGTIPWQRNKGHTPTLNTGPQFDLSTVFDPLGFTFIPFSVQFAGQIWRKYGKEGPNFMISNIMNKMGRWGVWCGCCWWGWGWGVVTGGGGGREVSCVHVRCQF